MLLPLSQSPGEPHEVVARAEWPGVEFLVCRERIASVTHWRIARPEHTLIVHFGGEMRRLETELEGAGRHHLPALPGEIWLVPGGHRYFGEAQGQTITYAEVRLSTEAPCTLPSGGSIRLDAVQPKMGCRDAFLSSCVAQMARWIAKPEDDLAAMMAEQGQALIRQHLHRDHRPTVRRHAAPAMPRLSVPVIRRLADTIEARLAERLSLAELADAAGLSVHHLLVAFRQAFGTTPVQYILDARLKRARWLLASRGDDIGEIALATGFCSHSHFTATFRRREGLSPAQFRAAHRTISLG